MENILEIMEQYWAEKRERHRQIPAAAALSETALVSEEQLLTGLDRRNGFRDKLGYYSIDKHRLFHRRSRR